jgi:hypothetical protein
VVTRDKAGKIASFLLLTVLARLTEVDLLHQWLMYLDYKSGCCYIGIQQDICSEGQKLTCKYADLCQMKQIATLHQMLTYIKFKTALNPRSVQLIFKTKFYGY